MTAITWQSVQAEALRRIHAREWPPGSQIPNEADIAAELGCARATVNRALRDLAQAGFLERRRKAGTRVPLNPVRKATFEIPIIRQDIETRGLRPGYELLSMKTAVPPDVVRKTMRLLTKTRLIHVLALHLADDAPFCLEDRWINPAAAPGFDAADLTRISANEWLVQNAPFSAGDIAFGAVTADAAVASHLGCPTGAALFSIDRATWNGVAPITSVRLTYGEGYRMQANL